MHVTLTVFVAVACFFGGALGGAFLFGASGVADTCAGECGQFAVAWGQLITG
jgi:hypothetical protein